MGIDKTLEMFGALDKLAVDAISLVKAGGFKLSVLPAIFDAIKQAGVILQDAPQAMPELKDLDGGEAAQIGAAAYKLVADVIGAMA